MDESIVRSITVKEVVDGLVPMPFNNRNAWRNTQMDNPDLRRTHAYLTQGTRPSKKMTHIPDIKRYLQCVIIANDGLLVVRDNRPFLQTREKIVVPRGIIDGLLTAIHLRFSHPSAHQMKSLVTRYFYALDMDNSIRAVVTSCHHCTSLKCLKPLDLHQSTTQPPDSIGTCYAADVMRRHRQFVFVMRETVTSFTWSMLIDSEKHEDLRNAILIIASETCSLEGREIIIRVDPAPGFTKLLTDKVLKQHNITLDIGRVKNINKNPVAERAIEELGAEVLNISPHGDPVSKLTLALATANLNTRIRRNGMSSREMWTQRDQITGEQLPIVDREIICDQNRAREKNHPVSIKSKMQGKTAGNNPPIKVGDLVYLKAERSKLRGRDRYIVTNIIGETCQLKKFTSSQFRSKIYDVHLVDCYPVKPTTLRTLPYGPTLEHSEESDLESTLEQVKELDVNITSHGGQDTDQSNADTPEQIQEVLLSPPLQESTMGSELACPDKDSTAVEPTVPPEGLRRSTRVRKPPVWQCKGDFVVE